MTDEPTNPDDSRVEVLPVPEGSIIWVHNIDADPSVLDGLGKQLQDRIGHNRFLVLYTQGDGTVKAYGDGDLDAITERIRAAIAAPSIIGGDPLSGYTGPACVECGAPVLRQDVLIDPTPDGPTGPLRNQPCGHITEGESKPLCTVCGETVNQVEYDDPEGDPTIQRNEPCGHIVKRESIDG